MQHHLQDMTPQSYTNPYPVTDIGLVSIEVGRLFLTFFYLASPELPGYDTTNSGNFLDVHCGHFANPLA